MALVVETGAGTPGANAYVPVAFVTSYLSDRGRSTENGWTASTTGAKEAAIIAATDYIETRWGSRFLGSRLRVVVSGREASGVVTFTGQPSNAETVTVGLQVYRFVTTLAQANDVLIGGTLAESIENLQLAVNSPTLDADAVHEDTFINYQVVAAITATTIEFVAQVEGESGNLIALSTTVTGASVSAATLTGGVDGGEQPLSFPRAGLYTRDGSQVVGIPVRLKQATAEYAVRAMAAVLAPDPTVDDRLVPVVRKREKVGPIEEETEYAAGGIPVVTKPYPAADRLLAEFVSSSGSGGASAIRA
jgi:uncharacterized protein involved in response to NO